MECGITVSFITVGVSLINLETLMRTIVSILYYVTLHTDINECAGSHGCSHGCTNTIGSFLCTCPDGLFLSDDERTCEGDYIHLVFCVCLSSYMLQAVQ